MTNDIFPGICQHGLSRSLCDICRLTAECDALKTKLQIALSIINDLALLHDSYIGYLQVHNMYNESAANLIGERVAALCEDVLGLQLEGE